MTRTPLTPSAADEAALDAKIAGMLRSDRKAPVTPGSARVLTQVEKDINAERVLAARAEVARLEAKHGLTPLGDDFGRRS